MDHLHTNWKSKVANMGEAPERIIEAPRCPGKSRAFGQQTIDAVTAARQQAGLSPYAPPVGMGGQQEAMMNMGMSHGSPEDWANALGAGPFTSAAHRLNAAQVGIELPASVTRESIDTFLGRSWASRVRRRQRWAGTYVVAKQLRKQGVGLLVARLLLLGRP